MSGLGHKCLHYLLFSRERDKEKKRERSRSRDKDKKKDRSRSREKKKEKHSNESSRRNSKVCLWLRMLHKNYSELRACFTKSTLSNELSKVSDKFIV